MAARARFLEQLPNININDLPKDTKCDICMEAFDSTEDNESPVRLPCGHVMGLKCTSQWVKTKTTCPLCRRVLFDNTDARDGRLVEQLRSMFRDHRPELLAHVLHRTVEDMRSRSRSQAPSTQGQGSETLLWILEQAADFWTGIYQIRSEQAAIERRLAAFESEEVALTVETRAEMFELAVESEGIQERLERFRESHRDFMDLFDIPISGE